MVGAPLWLSDWAVNVETRKTMTETTIAPIITDLSSADWHECPSAADLHPTEWIGHTLWISAHLPSFTKTGIWRKCLTSCRIKKGTTRRCRCQKDWLSFLFDGCSDSALHTHTHPPPPPGAPKGTDKSSFKGRAAFSVPVQKQANEGQEDLSSQIASGCVVSMEMAFPWWIDMIDYCSPI